MTTAIEATYRVVTPMFCGGAEQKSAELRAPSFKGVLRFWWRALAWSRLDGDLDAIRREENGLFGSASGGQARVSLALVTAGQQTRLSAGQILEDSHAVVGEGARYLGYGVMAAFASRVQGTRAGELSRACLLAPFELTVRARARGLSDEQLKSLQDALVAVGLFGGMGARSRKGYGSLVIRSLRVAGSEPWSVPRSRDELHETIRTFSRAYSPTGWPDFTAMSSRTRHLLVTSDTKRPLELLDLVGRELVRYRSWGHNRTVFGQPSECNFKDDHDLMKGGQRGTHPRRIVFGLPHNYGRSRADQVGPFDRELDRRASPLFIHLHECAGKPIAVLSSLPAQFLPDGKSDISVGGNRIPQRPEEELYRPVHEFLERLLDPKRCKESLRTVEITS